MGRFMRTSPAGVCRSNCTPRVVMSMSEAEMSARSRTPKVRMGMDSPAMMRSACGSSTLTTARLALRKSVFFACK